MYATYIILILAIVALVAVAYIFVYVPRMRGETEGFEDSAEQGQAVHGAMQAKVEAFVSVAPSTGDAGVACARSLPELSEIMDIVSGIDSEDAREFIVLCGKLACAKTDLLSTAQLITASVTQPFATGHDLQPIQETLKSCFDKTMPARDLDLIFEKYNARGVELLRRIVAADKVEPLIAKYKRACEEVHQVARDRCSPDAGVGSSELLPGRSEAADMAEYTPLM